MAQKKPVRSLDSLASLLSESEKEKLKKEQEELDKKHKKTLEVIRGMASDLVKKKLPEKEFNAMYDSFKEKGIKVFTGTDKDGDYIIHNKNKFIRSDAVAAVVSK